MNVRVLCFDPASNHTGSAMLNFDGKLIDLVWTAKLSVPNENWNNERKIAYLSQIVAALVFVERPDYVISEQPWGMGTSKEVLSQLMGAIKAHLVDTVKWQVVSMARKQLGNGAMNKNQSAQALLAQSLTKRAKKRIKELTANKQYDEIDAIMHGVAFIVKEFGGKDR